MSVAGITLLPILFIIHISGRDMKTCSSCKLDKEEHNFYKNSARVDGLSNQCKDCHSKSIKKYRSRPETKRMNRERAAKKYKYRQRERWLMNKYGISVIDYCIILANQKGTCAACGITVDDYGRRFAVDHDHDTGDVRGLLCAGCNLRLGFIESKEVDFSSYLGAGD